MKLINWNVNGIRARLPQVLELLTNYSPDVFTIQESKIKPIDFSLLENKFSSLGYNSILSAHNTNYHGVLTLISNKYKSSNLEIYPGRVLITKLNDVFDTSIYNCYIHQGQYENSPEYYNKLELMLGLSSSINITSDPIILAGDFNITEDNKDVWSTIHWNERIISCTPRERDSFKNLIYNNNLYNLDVISEPRFTWYGYKSQWRKYRGNNLIDNSGNYGIKIDHIITNFKSNSTIELLKEYRLPKVKPIRVTTSDHLPMLINL